MGNIGKKSIAPYLTVVDDVVVGEEGVVKVAVGGQVHLVNQ